MMSENGIKTVQENKIRGNYGGVFLGLNKFQDNKMAKNYGGVLLALIALVIFFSIQSPHFLNTNNILTIFSQVSIIAIMAFGMTFVLMIGEIDLSVGAVAALCGLVLGLMLSFGLSGPLSILVVILTGAVAGFTNGFVSARFRIPTFIVTVATMGIFRGIGYATTDAKPIQIDDPFILFLGNKKLFDVIPVPVLVVAFLLVLFHIILSKTKFGRRAKMAGGNRTAAEYVGINTKSLQIKIFIISGVAAAISGILLTSRLYSAQPNAAGGYELDAIAAAVLGGTSLSGGYGTVFGTFIGALIMGVINNGMNLIGLPYFYQQIVKGLIIIVAVYLDVRNKQRILGK
jgi:ribose transport system permease protein